MRTITLLILLISLNACSKDSDKPTNKLFKQTKECKALDDEAKLKSKEIINADDWNKYVDDLQKRKPDDCILLNDGQRF